MNVKEIKDEYLAPMIEISSFSISQTICGLSEPGDYEESDWDSK